MNRLITCFALLLTASLPCISFAADTALIIQDPYVRLAPPNAPATGAFMVIRNTGKSDRQLIKAESPVARAVELHNHINENGIMKMREVASIEVKAGSQAELKPGSYHVMLIGMHKPLQEAENIAITLRFDDGSSMQVNAPVRKLQMTMSPEKNMGQGSTKH